MQGSLHPGNVKARHQRTLIADKIDGQTQLLLCCLARRWWAYLKLLELLVCGVQRGKTAAAAQAAL